MTEPEDASAITDARAVAEEVRLRLDAHHQNPEDVRAAAHARWPQHPLTIDETVDAALEGRDTVVVHPEETGQDVLVDPHLTGLEADEDGVVDADGPATAEDGA
ncbi:MAG: hypothetical protein ABI181_06370 [Mycobacteriaceae bacterium]